MKYRPEDPTVQDKRRTALEQAKKLFNDAKCKWVEPDKFSIAISLGKKDIITFVIKKNVITQMFEAAFGKQLGELEKRLRAYRFPTVLAGGTGFMPYVRRQCTEITTKFGIELITVSADTK